MSRVLTARTSSAEQAAREALETGLADVKLAKRGTPLAVTLR